MPPVDLYSVRQCRIWQETVDKETVTRLFWNHKTKQDVVKGPSQRYEVLKRRLENNTIKFNTTEKLPPLQNNNQKKSLRAFYDGINKTAVDRVKGILAGKPSTKILDMAPVGEHTKRLLFDGVSKEERGRRQYLKARVKEIPESKYLFPLCSSWDYGWQLKENLSDNCFKKPEHGRRATMTSDFYTRNQLPHYHSDRHLKEDDARAYTLMTK